MTEPTRWRRLTGGPRDGEWHRWVDRVPLETHYQCPDWARPHAFDVACYDADGVYQYSEHPGEPILEPCECSLCPGHRVSTTPSQRYTLAPGDLERKSNARWDELVRERQQAMTEDVQKTIEKEH